MCLARRLMTNTLVNMQSANAEYQDLFLNKNFTGKK